MGGHLDSWHAGTGATDNAAGVAVAMEALRILHAAGLQPRRTVRVGLWDGEELEDYHGSMGYVRRHLGDPATMRLLPGQRQLSGYFNIDNGTGRIRGIFTQGNQAVVPVFRELLAPFADLEASTVSIANVGSTDHMPFTAVGRPRLPVHPGPAGLLRPHPPHLARHGRLPGRRGHEAGGGGAGGSHLPCRQPRRAAPARAAAGPAAVAAAGSQGKPPRERTAERSRPPQSRTACWTIALKRCRSESGFDGELWVMRSTTVAVDGSIQKIVPAVPSQPYSPGLAG
jgi:hypothetical protein